MNTIVNFEIAKLLKEKGFTEQTFHYYLNEILVEPHLENGSSTDVEFSVYLSELLEDHNRECSQDCSAPTIAKVVMWIYEKYGIWIEVRKSYLGGFSPVIKSPRKELADYISPTEAYSAAILYTLNNLI